MNMTEIAFIGYISWYLVLLSWIAILRGRLTVTKQRKANSFIPDGSDVSEFSARLCRAYANCSESFPYFGGLMLYCMATGNDSITNGLAIYMLFARIIHSSIHLNSISVRAVQFRFIFLVIQFSIAVFWIIQIFLLKS